MGGHDKLREALKSLSPEFVRETRDVWPLLEKLEQPVAIAALLYALAEERRKSRAEIDRLHEKIDQIMLELKTGNSFQAAQEKPENPLAWRVLPEADQKILAFVEEKGAATAEDVRGLMGYKNPNAATQRLAALSRQGLLKKVQSGKKVSYFV